MLFSDNDRTRISSAIAAAEATTSGEIVIIVASAPQRYPATALSVAVLAGLGLPLLAVIAGWSPADLFPDWVPSIRPPAPCAVSKPSRWCRH
ncbi:MAG: hypothetical protein ACOYKQ_07700 [Polymorphobacter sp.]